MMLETWVELKSKILLLKFYPQDLHYFDKIMLPIWWKGLKFIHYLLKHKIALTRIEINDWDSSEPRIWVDSWCYKRMSLFDMKRALKKAKKI